MKIRFLYALLLVAAYSCEKREAKKSGRNEMLLGEWLVDTATVEFPLYDKYNFVFHRDGSCDYKNGFYMRIDPDHKCQMADCSVYMGTKTTYRIIGDSLKIADNNGNDWLNFKIAEIKPEALVLFGKSGSERNPSVKFHFNKVRENVPEKVSYDAIIVSRGPCYGSCPMNETYIDSNGDYYFNGVAYNTQNDFVVSKGNGKVFSEFENRFNRAGIGKLKENYSYDATDGSTNEVSFIKNGKIYKTISDYWSASPAAFQQVYEALSYKYQSLNTDYVYDRRFDNEIRFSGFSGNGQRFVLSDSEAFYLYVLLQKSKLSNAVFKPLYALDYFKWGKQDSEIKKIETDGRYYRFFLKDGKKTTYDLGFDFVERNKAQLKPLY